MIVFSDFYFPLGTLSQEEQLPLTKILFSNWYIYYFYFKLCFPLFLDTLPPISVI